MLSMAEQFIIGTMRGSFIHELSSLSENIMRQILNLQLRVPMIHGKNVVESSSDEEETTKNDKLIDFSRPSDYRMQVLEATHLGVTSDDVMNVSVSSRMSTVETATSTDSIKTGTTPYEGEASIDFPCLR